MPRREKRFKIKRKRTSLNASNAGPLLAFSATVIAILGAIALIVFVALPTLLPKLGVKYAPPWQPTPTPAPTIRPTPTPHPVSATRAVDLQHEVVLTGYDEYDWVADPSVSGNRLVFAAGRLVDKNVKMDRLFSYDISAGTLSPIDAELKNDGFVYPVCNDTWLVYLDAQSTGGGVIRAMRWDTGKTVDVKQVYAGQPRLCLDGNDLAWIERTGSRMDKLFVCDLTTLENTTLHLFGNSPYGQSAVSMMHGQIIYADTTATAATASTVSGEEDEDKISAIYSVSVQDGASAAYQPGTYVHDPVTNGKQWAWRDGLHSQDDSLYYTENGKPPVRIAQGVMDYGISDTFLAYCKGEAIFVYFFDDHSTVQITPDVERERTQLLNVSDNAVVWMDITSRERDVMKYAVVK